MANSINKIVQEALSGIKSIKESISDLNDEFTKANKTAAGIAKGGGGFKDMEGRVDSLEKSIKKLMETIEKTTKAEEKQTKVFKSKVPTLKQLVKAHDDENARLNKTIKTYGQVQAEVNKLKVEYRKLATQKELNGDLSDEENLKLGQLTAKLEKYQTVLKKVDAGMGVYTRSVGSYGKAFDSLGFSVAQITRESPAFLNSLNTGFMAISNNIPILVDEITKLKIANQELAASGKPTESILRKVGAAFFSWQSLISAGIVALTVLGPKLIEFAKNLFGATSELEKQSEALEKLDDSAKESIGRLVILTNKARDLNLTNEQRVQVMEQINDEYDDLLGNIDNEEKALSNLNNAVENYIKSLVQKEILKQAEIDLGEQVVEAAQKEIEAQEFLNELTDKGLSINKERADRVAELEDLQKRGVISIKEMNKKLKEENILVVAISGNELEYLNILREADEERRKAIELGKKFTDQLEIEDEVIKGTVEELERKIKKNDEYIKTGRDGIALTREEIKELQEKNKELQKEIDLLLGKKEAQKKAYSSSSLAAIEDQIKVLKEEIRITDYGTAAWEAKRIALKFLEIIYDGLTAKIKKNNKEAKKEEVVLAGSVKWYQKKISNLTSMRDRLATTGIEFDRYNSEIERYQKLIKELQGDDNFVLQGSEETLQRQISDLKKLRSQVANNKWEYARYTQEIKDLEERLKSLQTVYNEEDAQKRLEEKLIKGFKAKDFAPDDDDVLKFQDYFNTIVPLAQSSFELIAQAQRKATQQQLADLERQKDIAIQFAGESAEARAAIEEQYERQRAQIQKKQAKAEKRQAIFSIALNTARGVVAALTSTPPNVPLSIIVGAIGATQLALAASQPIPEFWKGTMNAPEGLALVDEKRPEVHTDKHGNIKSFGEKGANLRFLSKGDKIYKSREEYFNKEIESNIPFSSAMFAHQMALHNSNTDTLSKAEFKRGIDRLMSKETTNISINKAGFATSVIKDGVKTNKMNNILRIKKGIV